MAIPESSQTVVNVTNGKLIRLLVNDAPFDVRYGRLLEHERVLDLRAGTLTRHADWESPAGHRVRVRSTRLVSLTQRAVAAIEYTVEAVDGPVRLIVQSELVANEPAPPRPVTRGWPPCWTTRWSRRNATSTTTGRRCCTAPGAAG